MAVVRRNDKDKVPSAGWQCVVLKYANLTLQEEKDTFRQDGVSVDIQVPVLRLPLSHAHEFKDAIRLHVCLMKEFARASHK